MTGGATLSKDRRTLTVRVPFVIKKRGGRKLVVPPDGAPWSPPRARIDNTLIKAIARAHRWKRLLESGLYPSVAELAAAEKINQSYVCRVLRLTLFAPDIVEAILDGRQPPELQMDRLLKPFPVEWGEQRGACMEHHESIEVCRTSWIIHCFQAMVAGAKESTMIIHCSGCSTGTLDIVAVDKKAGVIAICETMHFRFGFRLW